MIKVSVLSVAVVAAALALVGCHKTVPKINHAQDTIVRGYLVISTRNAPVGVKDNNIVVAAPGVVRDIAIPGVEVHLEDTGASMKSNPVTTDLSGRFTLDAPKKGKYRLCWNSSVYGSGCTSEYWDVGAAPSFVSSVHMSIASKDKLAAIYGHVTDLDSESVRSYDPYFNINSFAHVEIHAASGATLSSVYVNNKGEYVVPYVPVADPLKAVVTVEGGVVEQDLLPDSKLQPGSFNNLNLKIHNHAPKLSPLAAGDGAGHRVQNANVGDEVVLTAPARDDDGDSISWRWFLNEGAGTLSSNTGPMVKWKLPAAAGRYSATVVAYDGKGGYDKSSVTVLADGKGVPFSGRVLTTSGAPIANATVEVVGNTPVITDARGYFTMRAKVDQRYVLNARADHYALNSQIYDHGITGGVWYLHGAQTITFDPKTEVTLTDKRNERDCTGPASWKARTAVAGESVLVPQWQDGKGHVVDQSLPSEGGDVFSQKKFKLGSCGPGVSVKLPANSIIDASGNLVTTSVTAAISTIDLASPQQMPGDDGVIAKNGRGGAIESFGAGSLDLPAGMKLKPGMKATVTIPVDRLPLSGGVPLPPVMPLLSYDEKNGHWVEEGQLTLTTVAGVKSYVGQVAHFSAFNADNVKNNSSACVRVFSSDLPPKYMMDVSAPYQGTGAPKLVTHEIDQTDGNENVIFNLPNNTNITITAYTEGNPSNVLGVYVINSGNAANPNSSPNAPAYVTDAAHPGDVKFNGYISCNNFIVLKTGGAPTSPIGGEFLHGLGVLDAENLGFNDLTTAPPTGNALIDAVVGASKDYYSRVDPNNLRLNFHDFKNTNGFQQTPGTGLASGEYVAQFANSGDLGFGRDMHCRVTDAAHGYMACYVTNYGTGYNNIPNGAGTDDQEDANAAGSRTSVNNSTEVATVAMEYSPIEGDPAGDAVVKFFVYFNDGANYPRVIDANLDGRGQRPVPQLCMVCHGGLAPHPGTLAPIFATAADVKLNARFLPFDYRLYTMPSDPALSAANQDVQFKHLNQDIVDKVPAGEPASDPIRQVIHAMYNDSGHVNSPNQLLDSPVDGWKSGAGAAVTGQDTFYNHAFAYACRGCHTAQPFTQIQFNDSRALVTLNGFPPANNSLMLGTIENRVCGDHLMPHALRTHEVFWGIYNQYLPNAAVLDMPAALNAFGANVSGAAAAGNWQANLCTTFLSPNVSSPSVFYTQVIQPIFNGKCVGCHVGASAPFGIDLTAANSFNVLRNTLVGGNHLVQPGSDDPSNANNVMLNQVATNQMPLSCNATPTPPASYYTCLTPTDVTNIKAWLRTGAN